MTNVYVLFVGRICLRRMKAIFCRMADWYQKWLYAVGVGCGTRLECGSGFNGGRFCCLSAAGGMRRWMRD